MTLPTSGLHDGIDEAEYHRDPASLSSTGAKTLLYEGPRIFQWKRQNPVHKDVFDFGSVVHALILGVGDFAVIDQDSWRSKAAQQERDEARAAGAAPILRRDFAAAEAMRDAVMENRLASSILSNGRPEVSGWAKDPETGVLMRGRIDWLRDEAIVDVKTSAGLIDPRQFERRAWDLHYGMQAAWYRRIVKAATGADLPFLWVVVSKDAPHEVYVYSASSDMLARGDEDTDRALRLYADCLATDTWPSLADTSEIHTIDVPRWAR